jgi:hypothetical protein
VVISIYKDKRLNIKTPAQKALVRQPIECNIQNPKAQSYDLFDEKTTYLRLRWRSGRRRKQDATGALSTNFC